MPSEAQNSRDPFQELGSLNELPEANRFQQDAVWERLEARLQKKKRPVKGTWLAAACLMLVLGSTWIFRVEQKKTGIMPTASSTPKTTIILPPGNTIKNQERRELISKQSKATVDLPIKPLKARQLSIPTGTSDTQLAKLVDTSSVHAVTDAYVVNIKPAASPRFRIAHVNELIITTPPVASMDAKEPSRFYARRQVMPEETTIPEITHSETAPAHKQKGLFGLLSADQ